MTHKDPRHRQGTTVSGMLPAFDPRWSQHAPCVGQGSAIFFCHPLNRLLRKLNPSAMRPSDLWLTGVLLGTLLLGASLIAAGKAERTAGGRLALGAAMVERLGLTDLALFTEARYTRHLSQADRFAPFQDHPGALEHFPSGALMAPPSH